MAEQQQQILGKNIFIVKEDEDQFLVYAPLAGLLLRINNEEMSGLKQVASGLPATAECVDVWDALQAKEKIIGFVSPEDIREITILLNQRCNFSCLYCYSAQGRSNVELSPAQIHRALDFFISPKRSTHLGIVFSGGGDPVLSFSLFQEAVEYAEMLAKFKDITLDIGMVTNGSRLSDEQISYVKGHHVQMVLSFDILKDVHNKQRSHYDTVANTLMRMANAHLPFGLRCTITPLNVCRQCEMVEVLHRDYPFIKSAAFEAVLSRDLFATLEEQVSFYRDFVRHFFQARALGQQYGIEIENTAFNSVNCCKIRACTGKLVVTPDGSLTACSRVSLPQEPHYDLFHYGSVNSDGVNIDDDKYNLLMNDNALHHTECASCIAKWHCAGGCLLARKTLAERMDAYCDFMKRMTIETLKYKTT